MYRSGKVQFLFWSMFFSVMIYLWIISVAFTTFILPDEKPLTMPQNVVTLLFILYGFLIVLTLAGLFIAVMVGNEKYTKRFSAMVFLIFATILFGKGMFG
jgi:uncharacterized membrane protein YwaF